MPDSKGKPVAPTRPRTSLDQSRVKQRVPAPGAPPAKKPRSDAPTASRATKQSQSTELKRTQSYAPAPAEQAPKSKLVKAKSLPSPPNKAIAAKSAQPGTLPQVKQAQALAPQKPAQPPSERVPGQKHQREGPKEAELQVRLITCSQAVARLVCSQCTSHTSELASLCSFASVHMPFGVLQVCTLFATLNCICQTSDMACSLWPRNPIWHART